MAKKTPKIALQTRTNVRKLEDIPNVGKATAGDFRLLGIHEPIELVGKDPYDLYEQLCTRTKQRHDPCVIDVFIASVRYMEGAESTPWWHYTEERKRTLAKCPTAKT